MELQAKLYKLSWRAFSLEIISHMVCSTVTQILKTKLFAGSLTNRALECKCLLYPLSANDVETTPSEGHNTQHPAQLQKVRLLALAESMCFSQVGRFDSKQRVVQAVTEPCKYFLVFQHGNTNPKQQSPPFKSFTLQEIGVEIKPQCDSC